MAEHVHTFVTTKIRPEEAPRHPYIKAGDNVFLCTDSECRSLRFGHWWIDKNNPRRTVEAFEEGGYQ